MEQSRKFTEQRSTFPLIRHLSARITPWLLKTAISANQITFISMVLGLTASLFLLSGEFITDLYASIIFFFSYLLDHCDGEVARARNKVSRFGQMFDSFVDCIVHSGFFIALGWGTYTASGNFIWVWLGLAAALGATINYLIGLYMLIWGNLKPSSSIEVRKNQKISLDQPENWKDKAIFAFRELARADFWLLVLVLALFGLVWVLLPAAAIGAQVYWITLLLVRDKNYRV